MNFRKFYNFLIVVCIVVLAMSCAGTQKATILKKVIEPTIVEKTIDIKETIERTIVENAIDKKETEPIAKPSKERPEIDPALAADNLNEINKYVDDLSRWIYVDRVIAPYETMDEVLNQDSMKILHRVIASYNSIPNPSTQNASSLSSVIEFLLQKKADVNLLNDDGEDALAAFLKIGSNSSRTMDPYERGMKHHSAEELEPLVKLFIENGADIKLKDQKGVSTFERIVDFAGIDYIKTLPESDIEINNVLNIAVNYNHIELSHYLLEKGAILNTATEGGKDALRHAACYIDDLELFKGLVDKTSDINAMVVAKEKYSRNTLSHMIVLGQNRSQQSQKSYINKIVYLLDKGINIIERDWDRQNKENSLIVLALSALNYDDAEIVCKKLIEKGANVNLKYQNYSPLYILLNRKFGYDMESLFNLLIEQGADVNYVNKDKTPLDLTMSHINAKNEKVQNKTLRISEVLKTKGAKIFTEL